MWCCASPGSSAGWRLPWPLFDGSTRTLAAYRGTPMVVQGDPTFGTDSYTVALSRPPLPGHTVTITAIPPPGLLVWDPVLMTWSWSASGTASSSLT